MWRAASEVSECSGEKLAIGGEIVTNAGHRSQKRSEFGTSTLHGTGDIDARRLHVENIGSRVILSGNVRSWHEKDEAFRAAWAAPGVAQVDSLINVIP